MFPKKGSITVFLSLTLLIVLSLILTTIESVRVYGYQVQTNRSIFLAIESVFGEYYSPLYEHYHLFALRDEDKKEDNNENQTISNRIQQYMSYSFQANQELEESSFALLGYKWINKEFNLYGIETKEISIIKKKYIIDNQGKYFSNQAIDYMKSRGISYTLESILKKIKPVTESYIIQELYSEKDKIEQEVVKQELKIIDLMSSIDGIQIHSKGISPQSNFVKKLFPYTINQSNAKINNQWVYRTIEKHYVNPHLILDNISYYSQEIKNIQSKVSIIQVELILHKERRDIGRDTMSEEERNSIREEIHISESKIEELELLDEDNRKQLESHCKQFESLANELIDSNKQALSILDSMTENKGNISTLIKQYESVLVENRDSLSDDNYTQLEEELLDMKDNYSSDQVDGRKYSRMKSSLLYNSNILNEVNRIMKDSSSNSYEDISVERIHMIENLISKYSFDGLEFDYSHIKETNVNKALLEDVWDMIHASVLEIVIKEQDKISSKSVEDDYLPSTSRVESSRNYNEESSLKVPRESNNVLEGSKEEIKFNIGDLIETGLESEESLAGEFLTIIYMREHFSDYRNSNEIIENQVVDYELEYILNKKMTDKENLASTLNRLLFLRTMCNFSTIVLHKPSNIKASELATSLVSFTAMPALISIAKYTILLVQSIIESFIDLVILVNGENISLVKRGDELRLSTEELLTMTKDKIHRKASQTKMSQIEINEDNELNNVNEFSYSDYITILLLIQDKEHQRYRAMDLMQENIQAQYNSSFYMKDCIQSMEVEGHFQMPLKFINFPFIKDIIPINGSHYIHSTMSSYSY